MGIWYKMGCLSEKNAFLKGKLRGVVFPENIMKTMRTLNPGKDPRIQTALIAAGNIERFLMILSGVIFLCIMMSVSSLMSSSADDSGRIERNDYGGSDKVFTANALVGEKQEYQDVEITISARHYSDAELENFFKNIAIDIDSLILGDNASVDRIDKPMKLPNKISGYPFNITWESSDYRYLQHDGTLGREIPEKTGHLITITASFQYDEYVNSMTIPVMLYPEEPDPEVIKRQEFIDYLEDHERNERTRSTFQVPEYFKGEDIIWNEQKRDDSGLFLVLGLVAAMALGTLSGQDLKQEMERRQRQMGFDYPSIVSKLTLYMGAGLSLRKSLEKMVEDYSHMNEKHYAYDEIAYTCNAMASGTLESKALEDFGKRCGHSSYIKLASLLVQNLSKGGNDLFVRLEKEAQDAFQDRKNLARKAGEEAGTKLLFPMLLMMCVVMVMILVPAFIGFNG